MAAFAEVKAAATGRWPAILAAAGIPVESLDGRHHPCHGCLGKDRFRFIDKTGDGYFICGGGGNRTAGDGFHLLEHVFDWTPSEALKFVADFLGVKGREITPAERSAYQRRIVLEAMAHELMILRLAVADHLAAHELSKEDQKREKVAATRVRNGLERLYG